MKCAKILNTIAHRSSRAPARTALGLYATPPLHPRELVEGAKRYSLNVVGISWTKRRGFYTAEQDGEWKQFCFGVEPAKLSQAGVGILASPQLADCDDEWNPFRNSFNASIPPSQIFVSVDTHFQQFHNKKKSKK